MNYTQAKAQAEGGKALAVSNAGGRKRYAKFRVNDAGDVDVTLFRTVIAVFMPNGVCVFTGGYNTATTREALNTLVPGGNFWTQQRITKWAPYSSGGHGIVATEGMVIGYSGKVVREGSRPWPLTDDTRAVRV
jgi:hypothetical protein